MDNLEKVDDWEFLGLGTDSTLEKEELLKPAEHPNESEGHRRYILKYPRLPAEGVSWEDITELVASKIGKILNIKVMEVRIVQKKGRRGALMKNFVPYNGQFIEGGSILKEYDEYEEEELLKLESRAVLHAGFDMIERISQWNNIKELFIIMNFFDILIGNQDRHPYNWMLIFDKDNKSNFSPIYDNGASLGFRFTDEKLLEYLNDEKKIHSYVKRAKVKVGLYEKKQIKAEIVIQVLKERYYTESEIIIQKIKDFDFSVYDNFINAVTILTKVQKEWLIRIISIRREYILKWYQGGEAI